MFHFSFSVWTLTHTALCVIVLRETKNNAHCTFKCVSDSVLFMKVCCNLYLYSYNKMAWII